MAMLNKQMVIYMDGMVIADWSARFIEINCYFPHQ